MATSITNTSISTDTINVDNGVLYVDNVNNRVGVGTTSPVYTLVVSEDGSDNIEIGAGIFQRYNRSTQNYGAMNYYSASHNFYTTGGGQQSLFIKSDGNVGIGTANPSSALHISKGSGSTQLRMTRNNVAATGNDFARILFENSVGTTMASIRATSQDGNTECGIRFGAGGGDAERMRIDNSGRVTKPYQPSFESYLGSSWYLADSSYVPFNTMTYNTGNHYDASNYKFTAPVDGKYLFYIHTYTSVTNGAVRAFHFKWNVNGNQYRDLTHGGYSSDGGYAYHPPVTGTIILNLSAGDYVQVYFSGGGYSGGNVYLGSNNSYWGGCLLG